MYRHNVIWIDLIDSPGYVLARCVAGSMIALLKTRNAGFVKGEAARIDVETLQPVP